MDCRPDNAPRPDRTQIEDRERRSAGLRRVLGVIVLALGCAPAVQPQSLTLEPAGAEGFDVRANGTLVAPIRLSSNGAIVAGQIEATPSSIRLSGLRCRDPQALTFAAGDFVSITLPSGGAGALAPSDPLVRFQLTLVRFSSARWQALFPDGAAPFHFLVCPLPTAQVWHQRGWLNATPNADPFPLLQDVHVGAPEISCRWNRNWSYVCPLGGHPIPRIGVWDPATRLYVAYDFQEARATDQSERYLSTAYCWQQGALKSFIALAYPHGGLRYGEQVYPSGGEVLASRFHLIVDTDLPDTEDPNERFQARLFAYYGDALPAVPAMNDLAWIPGKARLADFVGPGSLTLYGAGGETQFYPAGTMLVQGWVGHREMPVDTAVRRGDLTALANARTRVETLLRDHAKSVTVAGDTCLFWEKPLSGAWLADWGGAPVKTLHNADAWYPARVLVELYRYDRARNQVRPEYLNAIDGLYNWTKHFVWTRNEFADVPSSPFAIGSTLCTAFLLDYYFTFQDDPARKDNAQAALRLARNVTWRYLQVWAMDSDRFDGALDSAFLVEPNSGRDWAALGCANEVNWNIDALTQVYVHTGDARMRYYLRGLLQRWPALYRPNYQNSLADYGADALTEGLGLFDGAGPGRGARYNYGFTEPLPLNEPVGNSRLRVIAGARASIAFCKNGSAADIADYRTDGNGACSFRIVASFSGLFDVSFSYPYVDMSGKAVRLTRDGQTRVLNAAEVTRPTQSPSSLYLRLLRHGDVVAVGDPPADLAPIPIEAPRTHVEEDAGVRARGAFVLLPLAGDADLPQDWNDVHSFAGLVPGERWAYGVPYYQRQRAATRPVALNAAGASAVFVVYAPPEEDALSAAPKLVLTGGQPVALAGKPVLAWRGWPPIFGRLVLIDHAVLPAGSSVAQVDPNGVALMAVTAFNGDAPVLNALQSAFTAGAAEFAQIEAQRHALAGFRARFAPISVGKIALLPRPATGPAASFASATGLRDKWVELTEAQLVNANEFNAARYPVVLSLSDEHYVKTVQGVGDGKAAITQYLTGGGTLVLLASGPFPFYYGDGPADQPGPADPLLPALGMPIEVVFEKPPTTLKIRLASGQPILRSVPAEFAFPAGDQRLRSVNRSRLDPAHRYTPLLFAADSSDRSYGDAAGYLELGAGAARGGKILYIWSTLLGAPEGQAIMGDALAWVFERSPVITTQPVPGTAGPGSSATFAVAAASLVPLTYQWRKDGAAIAGATGASLTLTEVTANQAGSYTVVVSNAGGSVTSNAAVLTVTAVPAIAGTYFGAFAGNGGPISLLVRADRTGVFLGFAAAARVALVCRDIVVDADGRFSATQREGSAGEPLGDPPRSAAENEITITGVIAADGTLSGSVSALNLTFSAPAGPSTGATAAVAGFYQAGVAGGAGQGFALVGPAGDVVIVTVSGGTADGGRGTATAAGGLSVTTAGNASVSGSLSAAARTISAAVTTATGSTAFAGGRSDRLEDEKLINISTRSRTGTSADTLVAGFVFSGSAPKPVLVRAIGPTLATFGVAGALSAARLEIFRDQTSVAVGTDWGAAANAAAIAATASRVGAFALPANSRDAALLLNLAAGSYTAVSTGQGGASGVALVEVYDASEGTIPKAQRVLNIATRATAGTGDNTLIAGFYVSGTVPKRLLIRGVGPALTQFGVPGALARPQLIVAAGTTELVRNTGIATSADAAAIAAAATQVGAFALAPNAADAAILINLTPGAYTAQVAGISGTSGVALVEIYEVP